jgi:Domain of unknown function (DUF397)
MPAQPAMDSTFNWRKSSASAGQGECVEVATSGQSVLTRDSQDQEGAVLAFTSSQWRGLLRRIKNEDASLG